MAHLRRQKPTIITEVETEPVALPHEPSSTREDGLRDFVTHRDWLLSLVQPLAPFGMGLMDAVGLTLAESIPSDIDLPDSGISVGSLLVEQGTHVDSCLIGLLASVGIDKVIARPRPRVVVISTEHPFGVARAGGSQVISDPASYLAAARATAEGAQVWRVVTSSETPSLEEAIADQLIRADLIVVTGDIDSPFTDRSGHNLRSTIEALGPSNFAKVAMVPGGSQGFALVGDEEIPLLVMPFEPVAAHVTIETLMIPIMRQMVGSDQVLPEVRSAIMSQTVTVSPRMVTFAPAVLEQDHATISGKMGGADGMVTLYSANSLLALESEVGRIEASSKVSCLPLMR
jgi:molybdopterin molybdotransferase